MGWLRSIFAWVFGSPYEGANYSTKRSQRTTPPQSSRLDLKEATRLELLNGSRDLERNDGLFNRLCDLFEMYVTGAGLQVSPSTSDPVYNPKALRLFNKWAQYADIASLQPLGTLEGMWARRWFVDGEVFIIGEQGNPDADGRRRPRLRTYESHLCETPPRMAAQEGKTIIDGIEVDPRGRPIAYHFRQEGGEYSENGVVDHTRVEAKFVIHLFEPSRPGQMRGLPFAHAVLNDFLDLHEIDSLEIEAAKQAARRTDVIETQSGEFNPDSQRRNRLLQLGANATPTPGASDSGQVAERVTGVKPVQLKLGEKFTQYVSQRPSVVTQQYYIQREEKICAGIGIPRVLAYPGSMQGTVYRGALDAANLFFRVRHSVMAEALRRVYTYWSTWAKENEPELYKPAPPKDWDAVSITPPRACNVDVGYNSSAMLAELKAGCTNFEQIYGPRGQGWREELRKLFEQAAFIRDLTAEFKFKPGEVVELLAAELGKPPTELTKP